MENTISGVTSDAKSASVQKHDQSCEQFAAINQVLPQSVRARICRTGSYFGVRPIKLASGRLAFPNVQVTA